MNKNMNVPTLRFSEFGGKWGKVKIGDISDCIVPGRNKPIDFDGDIPWITTPDIKNKYIQGNESKLFISRKEAKTIGSKIIPINSIIMSCVGELGVIAINKCELVINQQLHAFLPFEKNSVEFISYSLSLQKKYIETIATKTSVPYMNKTSCNSIPIYLPSKPEQEKIASFLTPVDTKIEQLTKKEALLQEYKKGVMNKIFNQEIRFKDEDGGKFPEWEEKKLGDLINFLSDYTANGSFASLKENVTYYNEENYAVLVRTTDLEKKVFKPERFTDKKGYDFLKKTSLLGGEIILANVGSIGKIYKVPKFDKPMTLAPNTYVISFNNETNEDFIYQLMNRKEFTNKLLSMVGSSTLKAINKNNLRSINVNIPFIQEQIKIANFLSSIDKKIELTTKELNSTKEFKKALLQQMFV
jgi:type I restriction enzyme S subunit